MAILTSLSALTSLADSDALYIVDVSNTTDDPSGSSFKVTLASLYTNYFVPKLPWINTAGTYTTTDTDANVIVNNAGLNGYFLARGNGDDQLLFTATRDNRVGIGTVTPNSKLEIEDTVSSVPTISISDRYGVQVTGSTTALVGGLTIANTNSTINTASGMRLISYGNSVTNSNYILSTVTNGLSNLHLIIQDSGGNHESALTARSIDTDRTKVTINDLFQIRVIDTLPSSPEIGDIVLFNDGANTNLQIYNGSNWVQIITVI